MAEGQQSAEKDLLRIIEDPEQAKGKSKGASQKKGGGALALLSLTNPLSLVKGFQARFPLSSEVLVFNRRMVNVILFILASTLSVYLVINIYGEASKLKETDQFIYIAKGQIQQIGSPEEEISSGYLAELSGERLRNIFRPFDQTTEDEKEEAASGIPMGNLKNLRLVGIAYEEDPEQSYAMIENQKTGITFFLKETETLEGLELTEIQEDKVIFLVEGQEIELR